MPSITTDQPQFQVFSVTNPVTHPTLPTAANAKFSVLRRAHRKSKSGCQACKAKRVKCDEGLPECGRCLRARRCDGVERSSCVYEESKVTKRKRRENSKRDSGRESASSTASPDGEEVEEVKRNPSESSSIASWNGSVVARSSYSPSSLASSPRSLFHYPPDQELFQHFDIITSEGLLVGHESEHYHTNVLRLAQKYTYLRHALLSTAALHLSHTKSPPTNTLTTQRLHHLTTSLQTFQEAISAPDLPLSISDALVLTSILITIQAFCSLSSPDPQDSWVYTTSVEDPSRLDWLSVQQGTSALLDKFRPNHCAGRMLVGYQPPKLAPRPLPSYRPSSSFSPFSSDEEVRSLPDAFFTLCGVSHDLGPSPGHNSNPYHDPLHALSRLLPLPPGRGSLMRYLHFISRVYPPFIRLVEKNDHRALLILAWWFGLMCGVGEEVWWCYARARRDCWAICEVLGREGGEEVRALLEFPRRASGFVEEGWWEE